ncbi:hypothetical protein VU12_09845 [Desulfobulbus sp. US4]|nr:hypothetical protein [Desulfobulbus sp. US4]
MGGIGSGEWIRYDSKKITTEGQHQIDIRLLKKQNRLRAGSSGSLSWSRRGRQTGSVGYRTEEDRMILNYRHRPHGGEWEPVEQTIPFELTPCNYGGHRTWFLCPHCMKRVAVLYGAGKDFLCRHCHDLVYTSQQENESFRLIHKAQKIRRRLNAPGSIAEPILFKPKHMHQKTFDRLRNEAYRAGDEGWTIGIEGLDRRMNHLSESFGVLR